jgi:hypothetical protein
MRIDLSSGSFVETTVTFAAAALLTLAGFEMLQGSAASAAPEVAIPATGADSTAPPGPGSFDLHVAMPHVDQTMA